MKRQIRYGVFETNSSSTHTLTICKKEEFDKWERGELLFDCWEHEFVKPELLELSDQEKKDVVDDYNTRREKYWKTWDELTTEEQEELYREALIEKKDCDMYKTCEEFIDNNYLETYVEEYTTESGDRIVIFGEYGHD